MSIRTVPTLPRGCEGNRSLTPVRAPFHASVPHSPPWRRVDHLPSNSPKNHVFFFPAYNMSRPKSPRPTVISWNVGPLGYMLSLHKMSQTLKIGAPVVLFQEIRIPTNAQRRIKMELGSLHPEYAFYIEAGRESRAQRSPQSSRWGSDLNTAVLTCLHREVFK